MNILKIQILIIKLCILNSNLIKLMITSFYFKARLSLSKYLSLSEASNLSKYIRQFNLHRLIRRFSSNLVSLLSGKLNQSLLFRRMRTKNTFSLLNNNNFINWINPRSNSHFVIRNNWANFSKNEVCRPLDRWRRWLLGMLSKVGRWVWVGKSTSQLWSQWGCTK